MDIYAAPFVVSPQNYEMFERWAAEAELNDLVTALLKIGLQEHRAPDWVEEYPSPEVVIDRPDLNMRFVVNKTPCNDPQCHRCQRRKGGYRFRWVGPWTCPCIVGDATTPPQDLVQRHRNCRICHPAVVIDE